MRDFGVANPSEPRDREAPMPRSPTVFALAGLMLGLGCQEVTGSDAADPDPDATVPVEAGPDSAGAASDVEPDARRPDAQAADPCEQTCAYVTTCAVQDNVRCPGVTTMTRPYLLDACLRTCRANPLFSEIIDINNDCATTLVALKQLEPMLNNLCGGTNELTDSESPAGAMASDGGPQAADAGPGPDEGDRGVDP